MLDISFDLNKIGNGVIAFDQETYMISRIDDAIQSYFRRYDHMGYELDNYFANTKKIRTNVSHQDKPNWFNQKGIPCSVLSPETNGWQTGRVKVKLQVTLEFYPDNPESFMEIPAEKDELHLENGSPLDDLRVMEEQ
ncbi:MAG: KGK domain-containing protein [Cyanobacteriota bacterium]